MSEEKKVNGVHAPDGGATGGEDSKDKKKSVSSEDLDRALKDLHKYKTQAKEYESKLADLEQGKLLAEGKKDELISALQKQLTEIKSKHSEMQKTYAWDKVNGWLKTKAATSGVIGDGGAVDKFVSLIDFKGRNPFRDETTFALEETILDQVFNDAKKEMPYFFGKPGPNLKDVKPEHLTTDGSPDFSKMSMDQLKDYARKNPN